MNRNCCRSSILVNPPLVAALLASFPKAEFHRGATGARHG
jgi:hypothetical protein